MEKLFTFCPIPYHSDCLLDFFSIWIYFRAIYNIVDILLYKLDIFSSTVSALSFVAVSKGIGSFESMIGPNNFEKYSFTGATNMLLKEYM